jgi:CheY-like chemotaxis protein
MSTDVCFLVVDDNEADRFLNTHLLKKIGYATDAIAEAADGAQALEILQHRWSGKRCVVLLDINMPVMDGFEFLQQWESCDHPNAVRVVMVTSSQDARDRSRAAEHECVMGFLTKPLERASFSAFLDDSLSWNEG